MIKYRHVYGLPINRQGPSSMITGSRSTWIDQAWFTVILIRAQLLIIAQSPFKFYRTVFWRTSRHQRCTCTKPKSITSCYTETKSKKLPIFHHLSLLHCYHLFKKRTYLRRLIHIHDVSEATWAKKAASSLFCTMSPPVEANPLWSNLKFLAAVMKEW